MKKILLLAAISLYTTIISAQLYVPVGSPQTSTNGNVGIGTIDPDFPLHIYKDNSDNNEILLKLSHRSTTNNVGNAILIGNDYDMGSKIIGYNNPSSTHDTRLEFQTSYGIGNYISVMNLLSSGNVGIGTTDPTEKLDVKNGKLKLSTNDATGHYELTFDANYDYNNKFIMKSGKTVVFQEKVIDGVGGTQNSKSYLSNYYGIGFSTNTLNPSTGEEIDLFISGAGAPNGSGKVGIGTTTPTSLLTVAGKIESREVQVTVNAGADFVFEEKYPIKNLEEVEAFVKKNKHLPEIAPAAEMEKDGIELGEMNIKLLQKVEELTLYLIEQNKSLKEQNEKIRQLEAEVKELKESKEK